MEVRGFKNGKYSRKGGGGGLMEREGLFLKTPGYYCPRNPNG